MKTEYKTKARTVLFEFLQENPDRGFTAIDLLTYLQLNIEGVNKTTVYRNLDRLCEQGIIYKYREPEHEGWFYQYSAEHTHCNTHMHGKCSKCGKLFHIEDDFVNEFEKNVMENYGLKIDFGKTLIIGICKACS
ncbi:Fur family transcriptional regulator, ferric uptake regulator [Pseudobutyrivibrio sp. JW11]|uniref:Fur family transcriptional regulator n=1 Tax=Pseudobutyrivibrio sp. JW11 TaxID=1855302 RepID=UPI0008ED56A1|nr:transcriptional repressor [Pseudobutyrivibrio sp. JW11]SFN77850.1 Fur family transcriptional regulator, ferric uptake regulator [Pseudobutyrivibrio sp. JW11]